MKDTLLKIWSNRTLLTRSLIVMSGSILAWAVLAWLGGAPHEERAETATQKNSTREKLKPMDKRTGSQVFREEMFARDKKLLAKYKSNRKKTRRTLENKPGQREAYRSWSEDKQQAERFYSRFKNDRTNDLNSVKVQMKNTISQLDEDRPQH